MNDNAGLPAANFVRMLEWLDPDPEVAGERYEVIRRRLIRVFAGRGCYEAEILADQTFDRVLKKIPVIIDSYVGDPIPYFYSVGRNIHREWMRTEARRSEVEFERIAAPDSNEPDAADDCLEQCLGSVAAGQRDLLIEYYQDEKRARIEHRRVIAERLGLSATALQIRLSRIRKSLRSCVEKCVDGRDG